MYPITLLSNTMVATSVRLPDDLLERLDAFSADEHTDRSVVLRRAIERGLTDLLLDRAVDRYQAGSVTAWRAAEEAGVTLWAFLDELDRRGLGLRTDEDLLLEQVEALG